MTFGAALLNSCNTCNVGPVDLTVSQITTVAKVISEISPGDELDYYHTIPIDGSSISAYDSLSVFIYLYEYIGQVSTGFSFVNQALACDPAIYTDNLESLSITSDTDYDPAHPAGADLKDIFAFNHEAYSDTKSYDTFIQRSSELYNSKLFLLFNRPPATTDSHNLSISLKVKDGETFYGEIRGLVISP